MSQSKCRQQLSADCEFGTALFCLPLATFYSMSFVHQKSCCERRLAAEVTDVALADEDSLLQTSGRKVQRLKNQPKMASTSQYTVADSGAIALTGGNGALGLLVATWLARRGAKRLLLLSRSGKIRPELTELWEKLNGIPGTQVVLGICDTSDFDSVQRFASEHAADLAGVFHCAGILDDRRLGRQDWGSFRAVLSPKAHGAMYLHRAMRDAGAPPTSLFVMFSSVTSLMGNIGQTNYGAANAFLDALAGCRRVMGHQGVSLQWGPWADIGMASSLQHRMVWSPLPTKDGLGALDSALTMGATCVLAITRFNQSELGALIRRAPSLRKFFSESLYAEPQREAATATATVPTELVSTTTMSTIKQIAKKYLKADTLLDDTTEIDCLGLDSIDGMVRQPLLCLSRWLLATNRKTCLPQEFVRDLSEAFNISLSPNCLFELETLADLVAHVMSEMGADAVASSETLPTSDVSRGAILSQAASARIHVPAVDATAVMATMKEVARGHIKAETVLDPTSELDSLGLDSIDGMVRQLVLCVSLSLALLPLGVGKTWTVVCRRNLCGTCRRPSISRSLRTASSSWRPWRTSWRT